jgi:intein/homing endonuclease
MSKALIPSKEYGKIIELYESGLSQIKIGCIYNVNYNVIGNILRKCNIQARDHSHKSRKYTINENYFDIIDTQNKAYILGLLYADGCNYPPQHRVKIELQEKDKNILEQINQEIGSNKPLFFNPLNDKNDNWQNTYRLDITNKHISEQLESLGVVQNKSLILQPPYWLKDDLIPHFLRGYCDGDGCISEQFIEIASTKEMCEYIHNYCVSTLNINASIRNVYNKSESNTKLLFINGKRQMQIFLDCIYKDAIMYIQRKYDKYQNMYNSIAV